MKERLIIKNFGPIKDVELELRKFNILIGEQGTGKSALAKLIKMLRHDYFIKSLINNNQIDISNFVKEYNINQYFFEQTLIQYQTENYSITISDKAKKCLLLVEDERFDLLLTQEKFLYGELSEINMVSEKIKHQNISESLKHIDDLLSQMIGEVSFVPTERIIFPYLTVAAFSLNKVIDNLPNYIKEAGVEFEAFRGWLEQDRKVLSLNNILNSETTFFYEDGIGQIKKNNRQFNLTDSESGIQSLIPLLVPFVIYINLKRVWTFIVEEPELNLFPSAQYGLIKYLIELIANTTNKSIFISTHSPYILTSLNNLMYAYHTGQSHKEEVKKIIEEKYWINPADVSAYQLLANGTAENIIAEDSLIMAEKIDSVSQIINSEYDKILDIQFSK